MPSDAVPSATGAGRGWSPKRFAAFSLLCAALIFALQFLPQAVPPLYPKAEWLSRALHFQWNFLFPFTGGSGPLPFYLSFLPIAAAWAVCLLAFLVPLKRCAPEKGAEKGHSVQKEILKKQAIICILILGLVYNAAFIEEYLFGGINGNAQSLITDSISFIAANKDIKNVMVYNDTGGYEIRQMGKYARRIYATPGSEAEYAAIFAGFTGDILYINIPRVAEGSVYQTYFDSCTSVFHESSGKISATVYGCEKGGKE